MKTGDKLAIRRAGFVQAEKSQGLVGKCEDCGRKVTGRRAWYRPPADPRGDDERYWCGPCARFNVFLGQGK